MQDAPEATCVCIERTPACGSNNETYETPCALHEEVMRSRNPHLKLNHLGPCPTRPWIESASKNISGIIGSRVVLSCEAEGFPVPDIFWEFHSMDQSRVLKLPSTDENSDLFYDIFCRFLFYTCSISLSNNINFYYSMCKHIFQNLHSI